MAIKQDAESDKDKEARAAAEKRWTEPDLGYRTMRVEPTGGQKIVERAKRAAKAGEKKIDFAGLEVRLAERLRKAEERLRALEERQSVADGGLLETDSSELRLLKRDGKILEGELEATRQRMLMRGMKPRTV